MHLRTTRSSPFWVIITIIPITIKNSIYPDISNFIWTNKCKLLSQTFFYQSKILNIIYLNFTLTIQFNSYCVSNCMSMQYCNSNWQFFVRSVIVPEPIIRMDLSHFCKRFFTICCLHRVMNRSSLWHVILHVKLSTLLHLVVPLLYKTTRFMLCIYLLLFNKFF